MGEARITNAEVESIMDMLKITREVLRSCVTGEGFLNGALRPNYAQDLRMRLEEINEMAMEVSTEAYDFIVDFNGRHSPPIHRRIR